MKRKRYTEEQIISILKEHEAGASVPELSRRHAVAENTIYRWKSKFGGMEVSEAKRLRRPLPLCLDEQSTYTSDTGSSGNTLRGSNGFKRCSLITGYPDALIFPQFLSL